MSGRLWIGLAASQCALAALLLAPGAAPAAPGLPGERVDVLVVLDAAPPKAIGQPAPRARVREFAAARAARVRHEYRLLPGVINLRDVPVEDVEALRRLPGVLRVVEERRFQAFLNGSTPLVRGLQSQILGAGLVADGTGVRVCVIDSGIDSNHVMYASRIDEAAGWDFINGDANPEDDFGHGAHVAGIAAGGLGFGVNFGCPAGLETLQGLAPKATLIGVKVLGADGFGYEGDVIAAIDHCVAVGADVINLSLGGPNYGGPCDEDLPAAAVNAAHAAGVVVVAAAGNDGLTDGLATPACASQAIAVGATYDASYPTCGASMTRFDLDYRNGDHCTDNRPPVNSRLCNSNRSSMLDVVAPGCVVFSANFASSAGTGITGYCGTSQAAPHVAGLAALLLDLVPTLSPDAVHDLIRDGAIDFGTAGFDTAFGWGRIDVLRSLEYACGPDPDGDGVRNCLDRCPADGEKSDPGVCGCGVADDDTDDDATPDCLDLCPADPDKVEVGACGCGVADTDSDGDGLPNCVDLCPDDPQKAAPGACGCGAPETDSDGDGSPNCIDQCPADAGKTAPGVCGCGIADLDQDGDETLDCVDGCPADSAKVAPGACGCGVADTDTDGDGSADCIDGCAADPAKHAPGTCGCGVADTDGDGDGTLDCLDGCPLDPAKVDPGGCGCGISDADADADGTPDCLDACPLDPAKTVPGSCGCGVTELDRDGDGTADCNDGCPLDPMKIDPETCGCGILDLDTDEDETPDCNDGCPLDPGKADPGACGCGAADTDRDADGSADCIDGCADDPAKTRPGTCGCGVADTDTDGDGIADCIDDCPDDPRKTRAWTCGCGVEDTDGDADGVPDCVDGCPADAAKVAPGACGCGVLDDGDGDGVLSCTGDCDDANELAWAAPGPTPGLGLLHAAGASGATRLTWLEPAAPGGATLRYDVLRTWTRERFVDGICLESDGEDREAVDADVPDRGHGFFYLVRARSGCPHGDGSLGTDSAGAPRSAPSCPIGSQRFNAISTTRGR